MRRPLTSFTAIAAASVLTLAACTSGASSQSGSTATDTDTPNGPLEEYFAALWDDQEYTQERYDQEELRRQELIAQCMAKEGFEYVPETNNGGVIMTSDDYDGPAWDSLEFAEKYGYGVVDWPGRSDMEEPGDFEEWVDPNEDYVTSLSESEQEAYYATLYGAPMYEDEELYGDEGEYEYRWEDNGCWGWADNEINSGSNDTSAWEDPEFEDLFLALEDMWSDSMESEDVAAATAEWAACMEDSGFPGLSTPDDAMTAMYERQNEIYEAAETPDGEWVEPDRSEFDQLQKDEIAMATADWKCKDKVDYTKRSEKAYLEAQQAFVDAHKDQLDALVAKHGVKSTSNE